MWSVGGGNEAIDVMVIEELLLMVEERWLGIRDDGEAPVGGDIPAASWAGPKQVRVHMTQSLKGIFFKRIINKSKSHIFY